MCGVFLLAGCGDKSSLTMPQTEAVVVGNGGVAVVKEDYLYYINGYVDSSKFTSYKTDNVYGEVKRGAIYRTKLDSSGNVIKNSDGFLTESSLVVSKVVGFSEGSFYILGDYIYYITPHMQEDAGGFLKNKRVDFCRIKLDGTNNQTLSTSSVDLIDNFTITDNSDTTALTWSVYRYKSADYVVYFADGKLISIKAQKKPEVVTMASDVLSVALPKQAAEYRYGKNDLTEGQAKFFITKANSEISGNTIARVELGKSTVNEISLPSTDYTYTLTDLVGDYVYFKRVNSKISGVTNYFRARIDKEFDEKQITNITYDAVLANVINENYVIAISGSNVYKVITETKEEKLLYAGSSITTLGVYGDYFYFVESGHISRINITGNLTVDVSEKMTSDGQSYAVKKSMVDINDIRRVYVMKSYRSEEGIEQYYLSVIDTFDSVKTSRFVGVFENDDKPARPEDDPETDDDESTPWVI